MAEKKVKALGFQITHCPKINFTDILKFMRTESDKEHRNGFVSNLHYIDTLNNYVVGSVLILKGHKKSIASRRNEEGTLIISKNELAEDTDGIEASLFAINPESLRGIIYTYHGSITISGLKHLFKKYHAQAVKSKLEETILGEYNLLPKKSKVELSRIRKNYSQDFKQEFELAVLVTPCDLDTMLAKYSKLQRCEISATEAIVQAPFFTPLLPVMRNPKASIGFSQKIGLPNIFSAVKLAFKDKKELTLKLIGKGLNGEELAEYVHETKDSFDSFPYDEYIEQLPSGKPWNEYIDCQALKRLIRIISEKKIIFGDITNANL